MVEPIRLGCVLPKGMACTEPGVSALTKRRKLRSDQHGRRYCHEKQRAMSQVKPIVVQTFRDLWEGKADWPLLLHGPAGTGKTCAALCLCDLTAGVYRTVMEFCNRVRLAERGELLDEGTHAEGRVTPSMIWSWWSGAQLAVLDELALRRDVSDYQYEVIKRAIDLREDRPAIYISNVAPDDLRRVYDDRIASRCCAGTVLELAGTDRRLL